ncbi:MAG: radical SAM protein [Spirochaetia bacterium]|nr:radical SAM protein [Spirochaetia bacterium]
MYGTDKIKTIYFESGLKNSGIIDSIRANKNSSSEMIEIAHVSDLELLENKDFINKEVLVVSHYNGKFLSSCPGSDGMVCCRYFVINTGPGCIYDCHYCFLQSFMNTPWMHLYGNFEDILREVDEKISHTKFHTRIGTGEYSDSLALEPLTGMSLRLVEHFSRKKNATLELKTKSNQVDSLLHVSHNGNTVISWSLNPQKLIDEIEEGTASLSERIEAAKKAVEAGYRVSFHFDPMIHYPGWESDYHGVIDFLAENINPARISWISLGTFRYSPGLKEVIQKRFFDDNLSRAEMLNGPDGKLRYLKRVRIEMYRSMKKKIREYHPDLFSYICMDTKNVWEDLEGHAPGSAKNLDEKFEKRRIQMMDAE